MASSIKELVHNVEFDEKRGDPHMTLECERALTDTSPGKVILMYNERMTVLEGLLVVRYGSRAIRGRASAEMRLIVVKETLRGQRPSAGGMLLDHFIGGICNETRITVTLKYCMERANGLYVSRGFRSFPGSCSLFLDVGSREQGSDFGEINGAVVVDNDALTIDEIVQLRDSCKEC